MYSVCANSHDLSDLGQRSVHLNSQTPQVKEAQAELLGFLRAHMKPEDAEEQAGRVQSCTDAFCL